jgi:hypothetical protein
VINSVSCNLLQVTLQNAVTEEYLRSKNKDPIAFDLRVGSGTVSKIISEWKSGLYYPIGDELRELVPGLRKLGISASAYAEEQGLHRGCKTCTWGCTTKSSIILSREHMTVIKK